MNLSGGEPHGAAEEEYDPEINGFIWLIGDSVTTTSEVVATIWHKWVGDSWGYAEGEPPTPGMEALAAGLRAIQGRFDSEQVLAFQRLRWRQVFEGL